MERQVQPLALDLDIDAQADHRVDHLEDDEADAGFMDEEDADADELVDHLAGIALDEAGRAAILADGEDAGEDGAGRAAYGMHAEGVKRVVIAEQVLEPHGADVAGEAGGDPDHPPPPPSPKTRSPGHAHHPPPPPRPHPHPPRAP